MNHHQIVHNDIKPQNYLVKFFNGRNDLTRIDIVLTDFGLVGQNSKGGTPIYASPECFDVKTKASDIFSLGRVFLFMMLPKESFLAFLFVPITSATDILYLSNSILNQNDLFSLISQMMKIQQSTRIQLHQVRVLFDDMKRISQYYLRNFILSNRKITLNSFAKNEIQRIAIQNFTPEISNYIHDLEHLS